MNNLPIGYLDNDCELNISANMNKILNTVGEVNNEVLTFSKLNYRKDFFEDTSKFAVPIFSTAITSSTGEQSSFTSRKVLKVNLYKSGSTSTQEKELIGNWLNSKRFYYVVSGLVNETAKSSVDKARELWVEVKFSRIERNADGTYSVDVSNSSTTGYIMTKLLPAQRTTTKSFYNFVLTVDNTDNDFDIYLSPLTKGYKSSNKNPMSTSFNIDYITCEGVKPLLSINNTADSSAFVGLIPTTVYFYFYNKDETTVANVSSNGTSCTVYMDK